MYRIITAVMLAVLTACTPMAVKEHANWSTLEKQRAVRGETKWSDFYKESYNKISNLPDDVAGKFIILERDNFMIAAALDYEGGKIDKETFDRLQRTKEAECKQKVAAAEAARATAMGAALGQMGDALYPRGYKRR